jgi:hypothetical protein
MIRSRETGTVVLRVLRCSWGGASGVSMRPKFAMWSEYGWPTRKRWRSRYRRKTQSSTRLRTLLLAVACVAGGIGISGVYPQIIDSRWVRGGNANSQGIAYAEPER